MECLYNTYSDNVCGYCQNPCHPYAMTVRQMKCKNCLGKQCKHFVKNENHDYWRQREVMKQKRKDRKKAINEYLNRF
jgi:hypothetical protein